MSEELHIKPYARLLTMLGDQLITDEKVALIEIIKNSYDADAKTVIVDFIDFDQDFKNTPTSRIAICDDGCGMSSRVLKESWMNPASIEKLQKKREGRALTKLGRRIQGEKGIGRFAIFKIGSNASIQTSPEAAGESNKTFRLEYKFDDYGLDFLQKGRPLMLEEIKIPFTISEKEETYCGNSNHGTKIEITALKGDWDKEKAEEVVRATSRIQPLFDESVNSFTILFLKDGKPCLELSRKVEGERAELKELLKSKAVISIANGRFSAVSKSFSFLINGKVASFQIEDLTVGKKSADLEALSSASEKVGDFSFSFYIFDLSANQEEDPTHYLTRAEKANVKQNRVYLYRDNIRVLPYGDPDDDWLQIDIARGTEKAGSFFSNDQIVGQISITGEKNPRLVDKTSREGLINDGAAKAAFISLIQSFLKQVKIDYFDKYKISQKIALEEKKRRAEKTVYLVNDVVKSLISEGRPDLAASVKEVGESYARDKAWFEEKLEITERLAGIGLAVETATHDIRLFLNRTIEKLSNMQIRSRFGSSEDSEDLSLALGNLTIVKQLLDNLDVLYPGSRIKEKNVDIEGVVELVSKYYASAIAKWEVRLKVVTLSPLKVKCVDAVLLQVLLNLFDNAFYWCRETVGGGCVIITIDGKRKKVLIKDNGKGVRKNDLDFIFEAFFSRKGEEGRGLGLYIARQLLRRYGFELTLTEREKNDLFFEPEFEIDFNEKAQ